MLKNNYYYNIKKNNIKLNDIKKKQKITIPTSINLLERVLTY